MLGRSVGSVEKEVMEISVALCVMEIKMGKLCPALDNDELLSKVLEWLPAVSRQAC